MSRLTYLQVTTAITKQLQKQFPSIPVIEEDIQEGSADASTGFKFKRPSFKVDFETGTADERVSNAIRSLTCRVLFFPTSIYRYSMEFLTILDGLETAFALNFPVEDRVFTIESSSNMQLGNGTQTKFLEYTFVTQWFDDPAQPQTEPTSTMETIELNLSE